MDLLTRQAGPFARVALTQSGVDHGRIETQRVGDDLRRGRRSLQVRGDDRIHRSKGRRGMGRLSPAEIGQRGISLSLPAPLSRSIRTLRGARAGCGSSAGHRTVRPLLLSRWRVGGG